MHVSLNPAADTKTIRASMPCTNSPTISVLNARYHSCSHTRALRERARGRESERKRERERDRQTDRDRQAETDTHTQCVSQAETARERESER